MYSSSAKWDFFNLLFFFFHVHSLGRIFFLGQVPCTSFVVVVVVWRGDWRKGMFCCPGLNLDTPHNLNAWNRIQVKTIFFNFHPDVLLSCENYTQGKHRQLSDTCKCHRPKVGLHCFFGLMFRKISNLLIHCPGNRMHYVHAVNQGSSEGSVSNCPVANVGPKCLFD